MSKPRPISVSIEVIITYDGPVYEHGPVNRVEEVAAVEVQEGYKCGECGEIREDSLGVPLYECGQCSTTFAGHEGNRCPDCNKFSSKVSDDTCADCEDGEAHECFYVECPLCSEPVDVEELTEHIQKGCG